MRTTGPSQWRSHDRSAIKYASAAGVVRAQTRVSDAITLSGASKNLTKSSAKLHLIGTRIECVGITITTNIVLGGGGTSWNLGWDDGTDQNLTAFIEGCTVLTAGSYIGPATAGSAWRWAS